MRDLTIFYDYVCPYVHRAAELMDRLVTVLDEPPAITWRYFSVQQINHRIRDGWQVWDQPSVDAAWEGQEYARSLRFFWAAEAARRQGDRAFARLHLALLRAIHVDRQELGDWPALMQVAAAAELDGARFAQDVQDSSCLAALAADHSAGVERRVFGTPTFVFPGAEPAYLKLSRPLDDQEARTFWRTFTAVVADQPYVMEIKRPQ